MSVVGALYLVLLAAVAGYVLIARVPSLLHTPMLSGSNFIHGIILAGAMPALANAQNAVEMLIGFIAVTAASANVVGGFIVTDRMLNMFEESGSRNAGSLKSNVAEPAGSIVAARAGGRATRGNDSSSSTLHGKDDR